MKKVMILSAVFSMVLPLLLFVVVISDEEETSIPNYTGEYIDDEIIQMVINEALKYEGFPYVYGGASPSTSFDCSGLVQWCFKQAGIDLPRTASLQYEAIIPIPLEEAQIGDLVFFHSTYGGYSGITHVGIYMGDMKMFHAGSTPIGYTDLTSSYWQAHLVGAGRVQR